MDASARGQWSSGLGFILAAAGSAIGLGNIWRFPYMVGENGGGAFVLVYLLCVVLIGLPVMLLEISLGRATQRNPVGAIAAVRPGTWWRWLGFLALLTGLGILSYYSVIAGRVLAWAVGYAIALGGGPVDPGAGAAAAIAYLALFLALTVLVVVGGVQRGIERWAKILMPLLLLIMIGIIVRGLLLPGSMQGVVWLLSPDFSKITPTVVLNAMAQAFFSLSLGMGAMLTYGSYLSRQQDILRCGLWVVGLDTGIAVLAGFMIFPALFALGGSPTAGPTLIFKVLPEVFAAMPGGLLIGFVFFVLLMMAALTSTVSLLEVVTSYFIDERGWSRRRTVSVIGGLALAVGVPSALDLAGLAPWAGMRWLHQTGFLGIMDLLWGNLSLALGSLLLCLFAIFVWRLEPAADEISSSSPAFARVRRVWIVFIRFICPLSIAVILGSLLFSAL